MMSWLEMGLLILSAVSGAAVVFTRVPTRQAVMLGVNGLVLVLLFLALQAPDVAFSELAVGTAAVPLMFLAALAAVRVQMSDEKRSEDAK